MSGTCVAEKVLLAGGGYANTQGTWIWDGAVWSHDVATPPLYRYAGGAALAGTAFLFAGIQQGKHTSELWSLKADASAWTNRTTTPSPPARANFGMVAWQGRLVVFGGATATTLLNDTWTWDGTKWAQAEVATRPAPRYGHRMAVANGKVVLFGGSNGAGLFSDTWTWDGATWTPVNVAGAPSARWMHAMASLGGSLVLFGGQSTTSAVGAGTNDTWTFDGQAWRRAASSVSPPARSNHAMAPINGAVVLFGGNASPSYLADTWTWDGTSWTARASIVAPPPMVDHAMITLP